MDKKIESFMANIEVRVRQQVVEKVMTMYNEVTDVMRVSIVTKIGDYEDVCNVQFHGIKSEVEDGVKPDYYANDVLNIFSKNVWRTFFKG